MSGIDSRSAWLHDRRRNPGIDQPSSRGKKYKSKKAVADRSQLLVAAAVAAAGYPIRWNDLPLKLAINLVSSNGTRLENVSPGGVTKSWRSQKQTNKCKSSPPPATLPQLQLFTPETSGTVPVSVYSSLFSTGNRWLTRKDGPFHRCKPQLVGFSIEMARATGRIPDRLRYYLINLEDVNSYWGCLPCWNWAADDDSHRPIHRSTIEDAVVIVLTGLSLPAFACFRSDEQLRNFAWKKHDSPINDPNGSGADRFVTLCSGIWLRGKLYALSLQGTLVVIEQERGSFSSTSQNRGFRVGSMGEQRMVPGVPCKHFREILVESEGEILLVFLIFRKSVESVDGVEVRRLDTRKLEWVRLHDLGSRVLFFGTNCCVSVPAGEAEELGCRRRNCVYFKNTCSGTWSQYDMEMGTINRVTGLQD
ncbi:unnamed protein product [Linum trigynum]|uniref:KIB1-4 beta-propeller domain-containing protein n=1 Tax=Linum trigynum TaxID=586398 RepID=A0AAV2G1E4_9ROSI